MIDSGLRAEINKRLTLNWLIQGAAQHAGMTQHHLVRDELVAIDPRLLLLYDQFALVNLLQWWHADAVLLLGWPPRFWRRAARSRRHPFFSHPLLSRHGGMLAVAGRQRALDRCKEKGLTRYPILFSLQATALTAKVKSTELPHRFKLIDLAKKAASLVWGIPTHRLDADLTRQVAFGKLSVPRTLRGLLLRGAAVGYGGVDHRDDGLAVVGRATNWQLLTKELVKGTAELICLHGLTSLDDQTYGNVIRATDRIEFEPAMLQTGGELWRRLLAVAPGDKPVSVVLMHLARLPANALESLMLAVIEYPDRARELLSELASSL